MLFLLLPTLNPFKSRHRKRRPRAADPQAALLLTERQGSEIADHALLGLGSK